MKLALSVAAAAVLLASPPALAQGASAPAAPAEPAPARPPEAAPVPVASPGCRLVDSRGVAEGDAETATRLICSEVIQAGAPSGARYRVAFGTLGALLIVSIDREGDAPGSVADSRSMTLHGIEEVRIAAPRLADAIVHGSPIAETQTVDNVVGDEARLPLSRPGKLQLGLGLAGAFTPYGALGVAPAVVLDMHYGMSQLEIGGSLRFSTPSSWASNSGAENQANTGGMALASLGGRYFTSNKEVSPYFGGGVAYAYYRIAASGFDGNASGFDVYVDAGIEVLRTHKSHLAIGARFDLPLFALNEQPDPWATPSTPKPPSTLYFAPLSVEARFTF